MIPGRGATISLRPATGTDAAHLLRWRNDVDAVRHSLTQRGVSVDEHARWLESVLADPSRHLWIAEVDGEPVGQVRVDVEAGEGTVSIAVDPAWRGRGIGAAMLAHVQAQLTADQRGVHGLVAMVVAENATSLRMFERTGFRRVGGGAVLRLEWP